MFQLVVALDLGIIFICDWRDIILTSSFLRLLCSGLGLEVCGIYVSVYITIGVVILTMFFTSRPTALVWAVDAF